MRYQAIIYNQDTEIELLRGYYPNGALGIVIHSFEGGVEYDFGNLTVNLDVKPEDSCAFIDTNNLLWAETWLQENHIARPTGLMRQSGFCLYPEYRFDAEALATMRKIED